MSKLFQFGQLEQILNTKPLENWGKEKNMKRKRVPKIETPAPTPEMVEAELKASESKVSEAGKVNSEGQKVTGDTSSETPFYLIPREKGYLLPALKSAGMDLRKKVEEAKEKGKSFLPQMVIGNPKNKKFQGRSLAIRDAVGVFNPLQNPVLGQVFSTETAFRLEGDEYKQRVYKFLDPDFYTEVSEGVEKNVNSFSDWFLGSTHILFLFEGGKPGFFQIELKGANEVYFIKAFADAQVGEGKCVEIDLTDHSVNLVKSKKGFDYLAHWKFTQFSTADLTKEDAELMSAKYEEQEAELNEFLKTK